MHKTSVLASDVPESFLSSQSHKSFEAESQSLCTSPSTQSHKPSHLNSCYEFIDRPIFGVTDLMSPNYFPISQTKDDLHQWIAAIDTLVPICCRHSAASPCANQRKSRTDDPQHNSNWDQPTHSTWLTLLLLLLIQRYVA